MTEFLKALTQFGDALAPIGEHYQQRSNQNMQNKVWALNPQFAQQYYGAQNSSALVDIERQKADQEQKKRSALAQIAPLVASGQLDTKSALARMAEITGDPTDLLNFQTGKDVPSAIKEYEYFNSLETPEEKQRYLSVKRANQMFDRGGSQIIVDPQGNVVTEFDKTLAPENLPETRGAQTAAAATAEANVEKEVNFPKVAGMVDNNIKIIDEALAHKGFDKNFGKLGVLPNIPGGEAADAATYIEQIKGTAFLTAIGELKGSGSITEKEGDAATAAVARLAKSQSAESARKALKDLKDILEGAKNRAKPGTSYTGNNTSLADKEKRRQELLRKAGK